MIYELAFLPSAKKEWDKLASPIKEQLKNKLLERLKNPEVPKDRLSSIPYCYKIKLKASGYRLVYRVLKNEIVVEVIAIGVRANEEVYKKLHFRIGN